jgi:hypothetical protein
MFMLVIGISCCVGIGLSFDEVEPIHQSIVSFVLDGAFEIGWDKKMARPVIKRGVKIWDPWSLSQIDSVT